MNKQKLFTMNCYRILESANFLGSIRPVRRHKQNTKSNQNEGLYLNG
jgi:hypothetical protein